MKWKYLEKIEMLGKEAVAQFNTCFKKIKENEMTWQPIETAPKDGTSIIVSGGTVEWLVDGWFSHCAQRYLQWQPTLWMPLPELPKGE
jgi:hypothetical protein